MGGSPGKTRYSNSYSHFSNFPNTSDRISKAVKPTKPSYEDQESTYMVLGKSDDSQKPNMEVFERYQREVQIEKRLINKVSEDRELSDLILNLHQYKKLYRELKHEKIIEKEDSIGKLSLQSLPII